MRSLTAAVFVLVLLGSIFLGYYTFTILFFIISMAALHEFFKLSEKLSASPYKAAGFLCAVLIYGSFIVRKTCSWLQFQNESIFIVFVLPFVLMAVALFSGRPEPLRNALFTVFGLIYAVLPFSMLQEVVFFRNENGISSYSPDVLLGLIFLIWINDTFAYLGGSLMGKNKMMPSVSPGKTWEGTITGILCAFGLSFLFAQYFTEHASWFWPTLGLLVPVLATIGDLVQSQMKRQADLKDTGNIMPGHGGILDRFDSLIFVTPFVVLILKLL